MLRQHTQPSPDAPAARRVQRVCPRDVADPHPTRSCSRPHLKAGAHTQGSVPASFTGPRDPRTSTAQPTRRNPPWRDGSPMPPPLQPRPPPRLPPPLVLTPLRSRRGLAGRSPHRHRRLLLPAQCRRRRGRSSRRPPPPRLVTAAAGLRALQRLKALHRLGQAGTRLSIPAQVNRPSRTSGSGAQAM